MSICRVRGQHDVSKLQPLTNEITATRAPCIAFPSKAHIYHTYLKPSAFCLSSFFLKDWNRLIQWHILSETNLEITSSATLDNSHDNDKIISNLNLNVETSLRLQDQNNFKFVFKKHFRSNVVDVYIRKSS